MQHVKIDDISSYMKDIASIETIDRQEEVRLANEIKNGDEETRNAAREKLICSNLRLVVKLAHEFKGRGVTFADLVEEGNTGLITAVNKYDPDKGVKFSCYAAWWIKEAMYRALHQQARLIRMPGGATLKLMKLVKAKRRYFQEFGQEPSIEELSTITGLSTAVITNLLKRDVSVVSMDETIADTSDTTFEAVLSDTADETDNKARLREVVNKAVTSLCDLDRMIVTDLFGLGDNPANITEVAQEAGMPVETLKERLTGILASLRAALGPSLPSLSYSL